MGKAEDKIKYTDYDDRFSTYVWNSETKQFFGRTGVAWAKLTIFYLIFYAGLACFAGLYYYLFSLTLSGQEPKWQLDKSLIGTNPGMGYRPMPDPDMNAESTLLWYNRSNPNDVKFWYNQLDEYIAGVNLQTDTVSCEGKSFRKPGENRACKVDIANFGPCNSKNTFGYKFGEPCILLKLNRIYGWKPEVYGVVNGEYNHNALVEDLKDAVQIGMPEYLSKNILDKLQSVPSDKKTQYLSTIWVTCEGEGVADKENVGAITFHPQNGIPGYYFPFYNQKGYQSPFIFLQLTRPLTGVLINVECNAWAKNIKRDRINRIGSVHFEIMID